MPAELLQIVDAVVSIDSVSLAIIVGLGAAGAYLFSLAVSSALMGWLAFPVFLTSAIGANYLAAQSSLFITAHRQSKVVIISEVGIIVALVLMILISRAVATVWYQQSNRF